MNGRAGVILFALSATVFGAALLIAMSGLPPFGGYRGMYGDMVLDTVQELRHAEQAVCAVTFDYRGFDTLGEEFILFAAVAGSLLLMRPQATEKKRPPQDQAPEQANVPISDAVLATGLLMFPFTLLLGVYVVLHGHLTPGGGFQGGVLLATAFYFVYLCGEYVDLHCFLPDHVVGMLEAAGASAFAITAAVPLLMEEPYMKNILPFGTSGKLLSTGALPIYNCCVGLEVAAGFLLLVAAFLMQVVVIRKGGSK